MEKLILGLSAGLSLLLSAAAAQSATSEETVAIAEDYLAAYSTFEVDKMAPFLADNMVFSDPTSSNQAADGGGFTYEGKENVLKALGDYAAQYKAFSVTYDLERRYAANNVVVVVGMLTYELTGAKDQTMTGTAPIVTAITVKDGKVVKHLDLYDYAGNTVEY